MNYFYFVNVKEKVERKNLNCNRLGMICCLGAMMTRHDLYDFTVTEQLNECLRYSGYNRYCSTKPIQQQPTLTYTQNIKYTKKNTKKQ